MRHIIIWIRENNHNDAAHINYRNNKNLGKENWRRSQKTGKLGIFSSGSIGLYSPIETVKKRPRSFDKIRQKFSCGGRGSPIWENFRIMKNTVVDV